VDRVQVFFFVARLAILLSGFLVGALFPNQGFDRSIFSTVLIDLSDDVIALAVYLLVGFRGHYAHAVAASSQRFDRLYPPLK